MVNEAVIVATARTPFGKATRGAFNDTAGVDLAAPLLPYLLTKAGVDAGDVEEVALGWPCRRRDGRQRRAPRHCVPDCRYHEDRPPFSPFLACWSAMA